MNTLDAAVGGTTESASVLIKAEATETRTLLNIRDLEMAFADEMRRPAAAAGPIQTSYELLVRDWTNDSGESGDKYDPELAALFQEASAGVELDAKLMQKFLDKLEEKDPTFGHLLGQQSGRHRRNTGAIPNVFGRSHADEGAPAGH